MKLVSFDAGGGVRPGAVSGDMVVDLSSPSFGSFGSMLEVVRGGDDALARIAGALGNEAAPAGIPLRDVALKAPIPRPLKNIFCVGRNYKEHVAEAASALKKETVLPTSPHFFSKPPTTVVGPGDDVPLHEKWTASLDYEVELAVVIGKPGRNIPRERVFEHIFGYTVLNDVTGRDLQRRHGQWFKGKGLDGSCPMGPWIVTASDVAAPGNLDLWLTVNGEERQRSNTGMMIFDIAEIVSVLSQGLTLEAGDIIATGTPSGVGFAMEPPGTLRDGDVVVAGVEGIGEIRNVVRAGIS